MRHELKTSDIALSILCAIVWVALFRPGPLSLPYFWDEADVYVPGARLVAENGLSFAPGELDGDYSRGHPPLLYLMVGAAFSVFGSAPSVGHLLILPFTVLALAGTYLLGVRLWDRRVGAASALLLGATPLFLSMGNMVLPEMPLTAAAVVSFLALAHGRLGVAAAAGIFAVLVKETGLAAAFAVGVVVVFDAWERGALRSRATAARFFVVSLPLIALVAFFVWQKLTAGYFVFPHHQDLLAARPFGFGDLFTVFPSLFFWHGRWVVVVAALLAAVFARAQMKRAFAQSPYATDSWAPSLRAMLVGFAALLIVNALFFAKMFWLERYVLPVHPFVVLSAVLLVVIAIGHRPALAALTPAAAVAIGLASLWSPTGPDQEELTFVYAHVIATHRAAFASIEGDSPRVLTTWPMTVELEEAHLGYVDESIDATSIHYLERNEDSSFTHVLVSGASRRADALRDYARAHEMSMRGAFVVGHAPTLELYAR